MGARGRLARANVMRVRVDEPSALRLIDLRQHGRSRERKLRRRAVDSQERLGAARAQVRKPSRSFGHDSADLSSQYLRGRVPQNVEFEISWVPAENRAEFIDAPIE